MAWVHVYESSVNGVSDGTSGLMDKLYDWVTGATPGFPGTLFTGVVKNGRLPDINGGAAGLGNVTLGAGFLRNPVSIPRDDLAFYGLRRGGVTTWFICDIGKSAAVGGSRTPANLGIFTVMTENALIDTPDEVMNSFSSYASGINITGGTDSFVHRIWPTYGVVESDFFTDGDRIHVVSRRSVNTYNSYQHFSFGQIDKASSSWVGGEYVDGCCLLDALAAGVSINEWNSAHGAYWSATNKRFLSGFESSQWNQFSGGASVASLGIIRVKNCYDGSNNTQNYCTMGMKPYLTPSKGNFNGFAGFCGVLGGISQGYTINTGSGVNPDYSTAKRMALVESPNSWNGRTGGFGADLFFIDSYNSPKNSQFLGSVPGVRFINIAGLSDRQVINNEWMVFPLWNRSGFHTSFDETGYADSGDFGVAYKLP